MLRTLIVDDEPVARQVLREELETIAGVTLVGEAADGAAAIALIAGLRPDLVLLDVQMPEIGGFDVVRALHRDSHRPVHVPIIVMVTAWDQHALQAFEAGAVDYLLKPFGRQRLLQAVERARGFHGAAVAQHLADLQRIASPPAASAQRKLVGRIGAEYYLLPLDEVLALQADGPHVWICTARRKYLASEPLKVLEQRLYGSNFQRIHRNALVNFDHVSKLTALSSRRWLLTLSNQQEFIASKRLTPRVWAMVKE